MGDDMDFGQAVKALWDEMEHHGCDPIICAYAGTLYEVVKAFYDAPMEDA